MTHSRIEVHVQDSVERYAYEHEVFLSFNNDEDALAFQEWLEVEGEELFNKFCGVENADG